MDVKEITLEYLSNLFLVVSTVGAFLYFLVKSWFKTIVEKPLKENREKLEIFSLKYSKKNDLLLEKIESIQKSINYQKGLLDVLVNNKKGGII